MINEKIYDYFKNLTYKELREQILDRSFCKQFGKFAKNITKN